MTIRGDDMRWLFIRDYIITRGYVILSKKTGAPFQRSSHFYSITVIQGIVPFVQ